MEKTIADICNSIEIDRYFIEMLEQLKGSIIVNLYNSGYTLTLGLCDQIRPVKLTQLSVAYNGTRRAMGAFVGSKGDIWIGTQIQLTNYRKHTEPHPDNNGETERKPFDGYYVPRKIHIIGDVDVHDIEECDNQLYFVSVLFNSICIPSKTHGFKIYWRPPWIKSDLKNNTPAEDRCHLNGFCCVDGLPRYATSISRSNIVNGWKDSRINGGIVWDIKKNKMCCHGLSMPHSPRWYQEKLYLLNSGRGEFGYINFDETLKNVKGEDYHPFVKIAFIPSFLRGLAFCGNYAIIGGSSDRHDSMFKNLPLYDILKAEEITPVCGVFIVNINTGNVCNYLHFVNNDVVKEIYDVAFVPNIRRLQLEEYRFESLARQFTVEEASSD
jgi:uncharacterized protein (TIGR03032 family)